MVDSYCAQHRLHRTLVVCGTHGEPSETNTRIPDQNNLLTRSDRQVETTLYLANSPKKGQNTWEDSLKKPDTWH